MTLDKSSISILVGASETLAATVSPKDAANKKVSWKSDKPEIASVDDNGKVTGVAAGEATITVTTEDGGLRKLYPDGEYEAETIAPLTGTDKRIIGIVIYAGRHATDNSDYTKALTEGGPTISGNVNGYAMAITNATGTRTSMTADRPAWLIGPGGGDYIYDLKNSYIWLRHIYCSRLGITNKFVMLSASEYICGLDLKQSKLL